MARGIGLGLGLGLPPAGGSPAARFSTASRTLISAWSVPPSITRQIQMNALMTGLVADGVMPLILGMWVANSNDQGSRLNWKTPASFPLVNVSTGPTFVADRGWTGDGLATALSTQITPSTDGGAIYTQNSASLHVWARTNVAENAADIGAAVTNNAFIRARSAGDAISGTINTAATSTASIASSIGMTSMTRPDAANERIYKNGVQQGTDLAVASVGLPAAAIRLCGRGNDLFSTKQIAAGVVGGHMTTAQILALYNRLNTFLTAIGAA